MRARHLILSALFCALIAVGAMLSIPIPGGSVTLQLFFMLLAAFLLPPRTAFFSLLCYITLGLCGAPIFAGFTGGLSAAVSPTFGFLLGMLFAAPLISALYRCPKDKRHAALLASLAGLAVVYLCGVLYGSLILPGSWRALLIYLPIDLLKLIAAASLAKPLQKRLAGFLK